MHDLAGTASPTLLLQLLRRQAGEAAQGMASELRKQAAWPQWRALLGCSTPWVGDDVDLDVGGVRLPLLKWHPA